VLAARLAAEDFGATVAGQPIIIVSADHQNKVDIASAVARKGFEVEGVDAIFELSNSAASLAVQEIARERNKVVVHVGSEEESRCVDTDWQMVPLEISWAAGRAKPGGELVWQGVFADRGAVALRFYSLARRLTKAVFANSGNSWFILTADYAFGKTMEAEVTNTLKRLNGKMLGSVRHPMGTHDFSSFLLQAQATKPKVLGLASGGDDPMNALKQAQEFGMGSDMKFAFFIFYVNYVKALGPEVSKGLQYLSGYYWDRDEASRAFATRFAASSNGAMRTEVQAGVYSAVRHYLRAVAVTKSHDGLVNMRQMNEMKAMPLDDFFAPGATIHADGRLMNDQYLVEGKGPGEVNGPWDVLKVVRTVKAAEIIRPIEDGGCPHLDGPTK
jgi:branched-chain amino acid transport system substrate-binding protein